MIITICNAKGGTGKTTLTANLGGLLSEAGHRVLLVDADVQPTLSAYYPIEERAEHGLTHLVQSATLEDCVSRTSIGCDLVRSDDPEARLQNWILHSPDGRFRLLRALRDATYDYVLIDTQGAIGPLQDSAMLAADRILSPVPPETLSAREFLRGTLEGLQKLRPLCEIIGRGLPPVHALLYRMDRTVDARRVAGQLRSGLSTLGETRDVHILDSVVRAAVAYREAATARLPVHRIDSRAGQEIFALACELLGQETLEQGKEVMA